ncbi:MAG: hypothetical protein EBR82_27755 [Caulobacteraceae bacterium]|nr:hypothetical protein [Caulobacteraceae bacterium]
MVQRAKKALKWVDTLKSGSRMLLGKGLSQAVNARAMEAVASPPSYAKGGVVKRTGMAKVHKGEKVLTAAQRKQLKKML